jgi:membrane-bound lytic murein transglycosylase MltF
MSLVTESTIENIIDQFDNGQIDYTASMEQFASEQPAILNFLLSDSEVVLSEDEIQYMLYLSIIIWLSIKETQPVLPQISSEQIAEAEEKNWAEYENIPGKSFHKCVDAFFEKTNQEDLLAFIEDSVLGEIEEEEESSFQLTPEGMEPIFMALKTQIDVLTT